MMRRLLPILAAVVMTVAPPARGARTTTPSDAATKPPALDDAGIDQRIGGALPLDVTFRDHRGREVRLGDFFRDKPVILAPMYYSCPMLCPVLTEGLARSLKVLSFTAADYELVAFSFDPDDGPADAAEKRDKALSLYDRSGAERWHFLTGDAESIRRLTDAIGFKYARDEKTGQFVHAATIVLATPEGKVSRYLYGVEFAPKDLRLGLVEASEERLGNPVDQVLLFCYRYDPNTGRYTILTMRLLHIAAAVTLVGLATLITLLVRWERKSNRRNTSESPA
jgi:protein SCO1/2